MAENQDDVPARPAKPAPPPVISESVTPADAVKGAVVRLKRGRRTDSVLGPVFGGAEGDDVADGVVIAESRGGRARVKWAADEQWSDTLLSDLDLVARGEVQAAAPQAQTASELDALRSDNAELRKRLDAITAHLGI